jgi:hypothetical protein
MIVAGDTAADARTSGAECCGLRRVACCDDDAAGPWRGASATLILITVAAATAGIWMPGSAKALAPLLWGPCAGGERQTVSSSWQAGLSRVGHGRRRRIRCHRFQCRARRAPGRREPVRDDHHGSRFDLRTDGRPPPAHRD